MIRKLLLLVMLMVSFAHPAHAKVTSYGAGETEIRLYDTVVSTVTSRIIYSATGGVTQIQAQTYRPGGTGKALNLDGEVSANNEYVSLDGLASTSKTYTFSRWLKVEDASSLNNWVFDTILGRLIIRITQNHVEFFDNGTWRVSTAGSWPNSLDNVWAHLFIVLDNGTSTGAFFVNNVAKGTGAYSGIDIGGAYTRIGDNVAAPGTGGNNFRGAFDQFIIYEEVLGANKRADIYNSGTGYFFDPTYVWPTDGGSMGTNLLLLLNCDQSTGTNVPDTSGNGNDGTAVNIEDADWLAGHILAAGSDNMITVISVGDGVDGFQGSITTIGSPAYPGEFIFIGDEYTWRLDGTQVMEIDRDTKTFIIDTGETTNPQQILRAAAGSSANISEWQDSAEAGLAYVDENGDAQFGHLQIGTAEAGVDYTIIFSGETNSGKITWMEDEDYFKISDDYVFTGNVVYSPNLESVTAAGGITVTAAEMHVIGSGGPINITANPQIAAGIDGQLLHLEGQSETDTITLEDGNGLHLHGKAVVGKHDTISFHYEADDSEWQEISRNFPSSPQSWSFTSPQGSSGTFYYGGFYKFGTTANDFNPSINWGTANAATGAHLFLVQAAGGAAGTDTVVRITGTSMLDDSTRTAADTEDLTVDDAGAANTYYETTKKWIGLVAVVKLSGPDLLCNYGWAKYYDDLNRDFIVEGLEATWLGGATDANPNLVLRHHKATGWTYNAGAAATPPTAIADMQTDYNTEFQVINGENGAWKRTDLNVTVAGNDSEGLLFEVVTTANKAFELGDLTISIRGN